ncbi:MAG: sigma-70 family RNA polymerase sigma factor [Candidatus Aminicenantes bacterium]|nr:sigma-70 family RNA polymerase sigma factor [Candidatus Aminicenantes bacterium]
MTEDAARGAVSDETLAAESAAGSEASFEELVRRFTPRLFRYLRPKTASDDEAEDLIQDTFRKAFQNIARFDADYRFSTWLYTIAHRQAISLFRARRAQTSALAEAVDGSSGPEDLLVRREEVRNFWTLARRLPRQQYRAFWLRYAEDLSVAEIARVMKRPAAHVRVILHRGRLKLAAAFKKEEERKTSPATRRNVPLL